MIIASEKISPDIFSLKIKAPQAASVCRPGQFMMVHLDRGDMILPRPISICDCDREKGIITLVYRIVGGGTKHLSELTAGYELRLTGPFGNGFTIEDGLKKALLVGGGIGTPPLILLLKELNSRGVESEVYLGFRDTSVLAKDFEELGAKVYIATDSGGEGYRGNVVDLLGKLPPEADEIFSCGPKPMLRGLAQWALERRIPCQICLEERMACGVGSCVGCVVERAGAAQPKYLKVCCEGPVFYAGRVVLDE